MLHRKNKDRNVVRRKTGFNGQYITPNCITLPAGISLHIRRLHLPRTGDKTPLLGRHAPNKSLVTGRQDIGLKEKDISGGPEIKGSWSLSNPLPYVRAGNEGESLDWDP